MENRGKSRRESVPSVTQDSWPIALGSYHRSTLVASTLLSSLTGRRLFGIVPVYLEAVRPSLPPVLAHFARIRGTRPRGQLTTFPDLADPAGGFSFFPKRFKHDPLSFASSRSQSVPSQLARSSNPSNPVFSSPFVSRSSVSAEQLVSARRRNQG